MKAAIAIDPAIHTALRAALALLLAWAAFHKLRDVPSFRAALANYELVPANLTAVAVAIVISVEASIAFALPLSRSGGSALGAAALLGIYSVAIAINIRRGRQDIDCGCVGPAQRRPLSGALIGRNVALMIIALIAALPPSARPLEWIDAVTIVGTVAFLSVLYGAIDQIAANAPRLAFLRGAARAEVPTGWAGGTRALRPSSRQAPAAMGGEAE